MAINVRSVCVCACPKAMEHLLLASGYVAWIHQRAFHEIFDLVVHIDALESGMQSYVVHLRDTSRVAIMEQYDIATKPSTFLNSRVEMSSVAVQ